MGKPLNRVVSIVEELLTFSCKYIFKQLCHQDLSIWLWAGIFDQTLHTQVICFAVREEFP